MAGPPTANPGLAPGERNLFPLSTGALQAPLLQTKLFAPPPRLGSISRPRLVERLRDVMERKLVLVAAPAGFGKTTALGWWHESPAARDIRLSWVSLDPGDNDPGRFWTYVFTALDAIEPGCASAPLAALNGTVPGSLPAIESLLTVLINGLSGLAADAVLVLDDYHNIESMAVHEGVDFLLEHLPPSLHIVISTRADPPLRLARLRARGELAEIRAADLRFTADEAAEFLTEGMGLRLDHRAVAALEARTEGWIAGLQLAALALRGREDVDSFISAFTGSNRFVLDYLGDEVLSSQPAHLQTFLLRTSVLGRFCAPLCDAVVGQDGGPGGMRDAQSILEELDRANLFVVPLDDNRRWYRYHQLFAEVLQGRLQAAERAEVILELHRRASAWLEAQGLFVEAINHAVAGQDWDRAARVLEEHAYEIGFGGQVDTVLRWLTACPPAILRSHQFLLMTRAFMLMFASQLDAAEAQVDEVEATIDPAIPSVEARRIRGYGALARAEMEMMRGQTARAAELGQEALALFPPDEAGPNRMRPTAMMLASMAYRVTGDVGATSERAATAPVEPLRATGDLFGFVTAVTSLARLQMAQGRLRRAEATLALASDLPGGPVGLHDLFSGAAYVFALGDIHLERNELDEASRYVTQGMDLARGTVTVQAGATVQGFTALARLQQARGESEAAIATLDQLMETAREQGFAPRLVARAAAARAEAWLRTATATGRQAETVALAEADRWAAESGLSVDDEVAYPREAEYLALARLLTARGRHEPDALRDALRLLTRLLASAEDGHRGRSIIEILTLRALARAALGDAQGASSDLDRALELAAPEGYIRVFLDEGRPLADLLHTSRGHGASRSHALRLLQLSGSSASAAPGSELSASPLPSAVAAPIESLSERELEVLRLIAGGASNRDIARTLYLSIGTVKKHTNNIFGKLGVSSRTQAVAAGRSLGLLP